MRRAIYAGSFDPFHKGHLDIVARASKLFDEVYIVIAKNPNKIRQFDATQMVSAIQQTLIENNLTNCGCFLANDDEYTVDVAKSIGAKYLIRGLRDADDFVYEMEMANNNSELAPDIETIFLPTSSTYNFISSRYVNYMLLTQKYDTAKLVTPSPVFNLCKGIIEKNESKN